MMCLLLLLAFGAIAQAQRCDPQTEGVNVARLGIASQSSTYVHDPMPGPERALDGNNKVNAIIHPCSHTYNDFEPWWRVDLKKTYAVNSVVIVNRMDCCSERLEGAQVRIGNSADNNNPICGTISDASQATITLFCNGMVGRYLSVVISGRQEFLTLCEVEVYGQESDDKGKTRH